MSAGNDPDGVAGRGGFHKVARCGSGKAARLACAIVLNSCFAAAQTFEVASVKPAAPYQGGPIHIGTAGGPGAADPIRLTFSNATLAMVLNTAFDLQDSQKIDGPEWLNIDMFDIAAKLPPGASKDEMRAMLRNLLTERFHLASHRERRDLPAYVLVAAKGRVRLPAPKNAASSPSREDHSGPGFRRLRCGNCTVAQFVKMLGNDAGRRIFDETGLTGNYDFALTYEPDYGLCKQCTTGGDGAPDPPAPPASNDGPPVLSVGLDQQLGLKLEKKQRPVDVIVIDHIDRIPVAN